MRAQSIRPSVEKVFPSLDSLSESHKVKLGHRSCFLGLRDSGNKDVRQDLGMSSLGESMVSKRKRTQRRNEECRSSSNGHRWPWSWLDSTGLFYTKQGRD